MPSLRIQRVRELLKRAIGETLRREFPVSEAGLITVNDVVVAGDLKSATVFISILGNADQQKRARDLLHFYGQVVIVPRKPLERGATYEVSATVNEHPYKWSFTVSR